MFINSKVPVNFKDFKGNTCFVKKDFIGEVPEWVTESGHFKALVSKGLITFGQNFSDKAIEKKDSEAEAKAKRAEEEAKKARKLDEAINKAKEEAEKEAIEQGLDESTKNNLIKKKVKEATEKK